jgi:glycosyltransferase involved in cell wall biosynthesis
MIGVRGLASDPPRRFRSGGELQVGGAELAAEELSRALARRGHQITLFTRELGPVRDVHGVRLRPSAFIPGRRSEALTHTITATLKALASGHDILHFHAVGPGACAVMARLGGVPSVVTVQGLDWSREKWSRWEGRLIRALASVGLRAADRLVAVAPNLVQPLRLRSLAASQSVVIPNGVSPLGPEDPNALPALGLESRGYLLLLSRLVPEKNVHVAIEAHRRGGVALPLVIAGGGSHSNGYINELRAGAGGDPGIRFVGVVRGGARSSLLRNAAALINASSVEGLSLAVLEALGAGVPVALSRIPGNLDVFRLIGASPPSDLTFEAGAVEPLRDTMQRIARLDASQRSAWQEYGTRASRIFCWEQIAREHEAMYWSVVQDIA